MLNGVVVRSPLTARRWQGELAGSLPKHRRQSTVDLRFQSLTVFRSSHVLRNVHLERSASQRWSLDVRGVRTKNRMGRGDVSWQRVD